MNRTAMLAAILVAIVTPAHAQQNATQVYLKTATYKVTKQVTTVSSTGVKTTKTVTVASVPSLWEAIQKLKTLPVGDYRIVQPSPYVKVMPCDLPAGKLAICLDNVDQRLLTFNVVPTVEAPKP